MSDTALLQSLLFHKSINLCQLSGASVTNFITAPSVKGNITSQSRVRLMHGQVWRKLYGDCCLFFFFFFGGGRDIVIIVCSIYTHAILTEVRTECFVLCFTVTL